MKIKHVVILAGGKGSRLRPYTVVLPKPLMPIGDYSILELIIRQLKKYKFERVTLAVGHKANLIKSFLEMVKILELILIMFMKKKKI